MSKYLLKQVNKFRADSEMEANQLVTDFKRKHDVAAHRIIRRDKKDETYFLVEIVVSVNSEKDPNSSYSMEE